MIWAAVQPPPRFRVNLPTQRPDGSGSGLNQAPRRWTLRMSVRGIPVRPLPDSGNEPRSKIASNVSMGEVEENHV
jgi:hypothetical protein